MYLTIIMNRSSNKQTYRLYFNFIFKFNFQVILTGNYASNLQQTLHACVSETYGMSSHILVNIGLDKSAIICSARTYNFQSIPFTICNKQCSYFAAMYLTIIMNRSSNKQIYRLYFNFICKFNFQVIITRNYASKLQQTLHACISETYAMSSPV